MIQRIPKAKKEAFNLVVKEYKDKVDQAITKAKKFEREGAALKDLNAKYKSIIAANVYLNTVGLYCEMSSKSLEIMNIKNDAYLNNARKNTYQAIRILQKIVGNEIDTNLTDTSERLSELKLMNPKRILHLLQKIEFSIALVQFEEGDNSKWKWNFVEMYGQMAILAKNFTNFKDFIKRMNNPMDPFYQEINDLINFVKRVVDTAGQKYREKYELAFKQVQDMNHAIDFMNLLVKIHVILNEQTYMVEVKKTVEKWKLKLENDLKKKEQDDADAKRKKLQKK